MFRHVVMFSWADDVTAEHIAEVATRLDDLAATIDVVRGFHHGPDAGINDGNHDYVVVVDFDSADDYLVYRDHAAHVAFVADLIRGAVAARAAVQYQVNSADTG